MQEPAIHAIDPLATRLADLSDPPARLWVRGTLPRAPAVAIVGTRRAGAGAATFARALARDLVRAGAGIVSGGAEGIDACAHEGALEAGGPTWVVLPTPLARPYPRKHGALFERVLDAGGGLLSERHAGAASKRWHFLARNRLIAAFADAVVVVQAPLKSGALSTASAARRLRRPLYAVPASPWDARSAGNQRLIADGARPCRGARDVAVELGLRAPSSGPSRSPVEVGAEQRRVLEALGHEPASVAELVQRTGLSVVRVRVALVQLAARDLAEQRSGGWLAVA